MAPFFDVQNYIKRGNDTKKDISPSRSPIPNRREVGPNGCDCHSALDFSDSEKGGMLRADYSVMGTLYDFTMLRNTQLADAPGSKLG
jgi:hypothetical protein